MKVTKQVADVFITSGAINPKTQKPYVKEDFTIEKDPVETYALAITGQFTDQKKNELRTRVKTLIDTGRVNEDFAKSNIYPQIDIYELSLGENAKFKPNTIDVIVESLEKLPPAQPKQTPNSHKMPDDAHTILMSSDSGDDLSEDQVKELQKMLLSQM
jgi:hypothetical protein